MCRMNNIPSRSTLSSGLTISGSICIALVRMSSPSRGLSNRHFFNRSRLRSVPGIPKWVFFPIVPTGSRQSCGPLSSFSMTRDRTKPVHRDWNSPPLARNPLTIPSTMPTLHWPGLDTSWRAIPGPVGRWLPLIMDTSIHLATPNISRMPARSRDKFS